MIKKKKKRKGRGVNELIRLFAFAHARNVAAENVFLLVTGDV